MVSLHNIYCIRGGRELFRGLSLSLLPGSLLCLLGSNGSGKTSLLKLIAGLLPLRDGEGTVSMQRDSLKPLFLGHQNALKPELTVEENLRFWARLQGVEALVPAAMQYWGLQRFAETRAGLLSAGWQRRAALARLLYQPQAGLWLLDEPAQNLDTEGKMLLAGTISAHCNNDGIVIMATHEDSMVKPSMTLKLEDIQ